MSIHDMSNTTMRRERIYFCRADFWAFLGSYFRNVWYQFKYKFVPTSRHYMSYRYLCNSWVLCTPLWIFWVSATWRHNLSASGIMSYLDTSKNDTSFIQLYFISFIGLTSQFELSNTFLPSMKSHPNHLNQLIVVRHCI